MTISLPEGHPPVPMVGEYQAPGAGDSRSVCPAINAMANHGYIPRDGKNISAYQIFRGLQNCYGLTAGLSLFLTTGGWFLIKKFPFSTISLFDLGLHNGVEHDASVVHDDCPPGQRDAPITIQPSLVDEFADCIKRRAEEKDEARVRVTGSDIVQARLRREKVSPPLNAMHAEIARGEFAIILGVWNQPPAAAGGESGAPLNWMRRWLAEERLPDGWKPDHKQTFGDVVKRATAMRNEMNKIRDDKKKKKQ